MSDFIIVNAGLCNIFRDLSNDMITELGLNIMAVAESISICATNVQRVVVDLSLALEPTFENILALLLSVRSAIPLMMSTS